MEEIENHSPYYRDFITQIIENQTVIYLKKNKEQAVCYSNVFFIEQTNEPLPVFPFWSDRKSAEKCRKEEWKDHQVAEIQLVEFMEFWCLGMYEDGVVAGINFDENLDGLEENPIKLLEDIISEVEKRSVKISFKNFKSLKHLRNYLEEIL